MDKSVRGIGKRPDIPRYNIASKSLFNLGVDVLSLNILNSLFLEEVKPNYIEETFKETTLAVRYVFKIQPFKSNLMPRKHNLAVEVYESELLYLPVKKAPIGSKIETDGLIYTNMCNVLNSIFDVTSGYAPFHFVYGKGKKAVEYFIGPVDSESGDKYDENITRDL